MADATFIELRVNRGLPFRQAFTFYQDKALAAVTNVTGWTFTSRFRALPGSPVLATPTVAIVDGAAGQVLMELTAVATAELPAGKLVWDLVGTDTGGLTALRAEGSVSVITPISI